MKRRTFLAHSAVAGLALASGSAHAARVGPNEKVSVGIIGCGGMGRAHAYALAKNDQCHIAAICDVNTPRYEEVGGNLEKILGRKPDMYQDFRHILDRQDIDAIFVVTPDHWHPLLAIYGCKTGKDVYVEKPVCTTIHEGRAMVNAARRYGRVMQVGTQQRSMPVFQRSMEIIRSGGLGQVTTATAWIGTNGTPVAENPQPVPEGLDWDLWLGPAPYVPFSPERCYGFMAWHDYARGGELTNWGVHLMDILQWGIGEDRPYRVSAAGGSYRNNPGADNYENVEALFSYPGCTVTWEQRHVNNYSRKSYGMKFQGTEGRLECDRGIMTITMRDGTIKEEIFEPEQSWANRDHHNNFFHCVRTRQKPAADIEKGFRATSAVLMAGIALKTGRTLEWDGDAERFIGDEQANRFLTRPYRAPWRL